MQTEANEHKNLDTVRLNFLMQDYWQKIQYLTDHFSRLWNRFNYFLTIQSALFGATILSPEKYRWWVPVFGALICVLWYIFGAQDRYLVEIYRKQIENTIGQIRQEFFPLRDYYYVGQTEDIPDQNEKIKDLKITPSFYQWRWRPFSTTKLPALFPVIILAMWVIIFLVLNYKTVALLSKLVLRLPALATSPYEVGF